MTWLKLDDAFDNDPHLLHIARSRGEADRILGIVTALMLYAARHLTDGFLPRLVVSEHVRSKALLAKLTSPAADTAGLLHERDSTCECLAGRSWPATGADYALHHYLKMNPTKAEHEVKRAKAAELRNRELLAAVRNRDRNCCRYCGVEVNPFDRRGARGLVYDHVDPDIAAGAANLVVSCRACNSKKGPRSPEAAQMVLLPVPGADPDPFAGSETDPPTRAARDRTGRANGPRAGLDSTCDQSEQIGPPDVPRTSLHPNPYLRQAITGAQPETFAGLPGEEDYLPPPGGI